MHTFHMQYPLRCLTLFVFLCVATNVSAQTKQINKLKNESAALQKKLQESEKLLRTTRRDVGTQLGNLNIITSQIGEQQKYVDGISAEVAVLGKDLGTLEEQLKVLEEDLQNCRIRYQRAALYMFRNRSSQSSWAFVFSAKNFKQMFRRLRYVSEYGKYQKLQAAAIREKEKAVEAKRAEITGIKQEKDRLLTEGRQQQASLQQKKQKQQAIVNDLNMRQKELQNNIAQTRKKQQSLNARIDQLIQQEIAAAERRRKQEAERRRKEEEQRRLAEQKKKAQQAKAGSKTQPSKAIAKAGSTGKNTNAANRYEEKTATPVFRSPSGEDAKLSGGFEANRGRLPMPITGSYAITAHFGAYNPGGMKGVTLDNKGINITGQSGAQARCVYDGEVSAIFTLGGLYNVIVRHGSYMSVYCNLSGISVKRGQKVSTRQTLGSVARDASGNCTLHFQLRRETAKLNPESWLGR